MDTNKPIIIGHRGAAGEAPENTLGSFRLAAEQGAHAVELDAHLSADGRLMVCHDATLDRTTDRSGWIGRMQAYEIREADAGVRFSEAYAGEKVPFLDEVFELLPAGMMINVEVKHAYGGKLAPVLLELLRRTDRLGSTVVSSFDHKLLAAIKKAEPAVRIGLLYAADLVDHAAYAASLGVDVYSLHPQHMLIGPDDTAEARRRGLEVYPYTANGEEELNRLIASGVSGIITDYPARLAALLAR
ncbi:glycerophosphodiester phosphodiesterase [Paenibacillus humicola]|uniref:glycerophosphodiester phosphodiesterase n=1 Tax=Paenibacillus humicola TaxID=3110540 RepID=UPI00237C4F74|nr:glycerophosphodiester phosphodiesterase family protein [Paenibacillus humicola]